MRARGSRLAIPAFQIDWTDEATNVAITFAQSWWSRIRILVIPRYFLGHRSTVHRCPITRSFRDAANRTHDSLAAAQYPRKTMPSVAYFRTRTLVTFLRRGIVMEVTFGLKTDLVLAMKRSVSGTIRVRGSVDDTKRRCYTHNPKRVPYA